LLCQSIQQEPRPLGAVFPAKPDKADDQPAFAPEPKLDWSSMAKAREALKLPPSMNESATMLHGASLLYGISLAVMPRNDLSAQFVFFHIEQRGALNTRGREEELAQSKIRVLLPGFPDQLENFVNPV
jgi:hypothetical protein